MEVAAEEEMRNTGGLDRKLTTSVMPIGPLMSTSMFRSPAVPIRVPGPHAVYGAGSGGVPYPDPDTPVQVRVTAPS